MPRLKCPFCGEPLVTPKHIGLRARAPGELICPMNQPYYGCGARVVPPARKRKNTTVKMKATVTFENFDERDVVISRSADEQRFVYQNSKRTWINWLNGTRTVRPDPARPGCFIGRGWKMIGWTARLASDLPKLAHHAYQEGN